MIPARYTLPMTGRPNVSKRLGYVERQFGAQVACATARLVAGGHTDSVFSLLNQTLMLPDALEAELRTLPERTEYERHLPWLGLQLHRARKQFSEDDYLLYDTVDALRRAWPGIRDWIVQERPRNLQQMDWRDARYASDAWHAELALQAELAGIDVHEDARGQIWHEWPDGWTLQILRPDQLQAEGDAMGHCVGGHDYRAQVEAGEIMIASLRDERNQPHVTFEVDVTGGLFQIIQSKGKGNRLPMGKHRARAWEAARLLRSPDLPGADLEVVDQSNAALYGEALALAPDDEIGPLALTDREVLERIADELPDEHPLRRIKHRLQHMYRTRWSEGPILPAVMLNAWLEPGPKFVVQVTWDIGLWLQSTGRKLRDYVLASRTGPEGFGDLRDAYAWGYRDARGDPEILYNPGRNRDYGYGPGAVEEWLPTVIPELAELLAFANAGDRAYDQGDTLHGVRIKPIGVRINRRPLHWIGTTETRDFPPEWVYLTTTYEVDLPAHDLERAVHLISAQTFGDAVTSDTEELKRKAMEIYQLRQVG